MTKERRLSLKTRLSGSKEVENEVEIIQYADGAMAFTNIMGEHFIYLYRDQKQQLAKILKGVRTK